MLSLPPVSHSRGFAQDTKESLVQFLFQYRVLIKMVSPMNQHKSSDLFDKDMCHFCSCKSKQWYFIVNEDKCKGPVFDLAAYYLQKDIPVNIEVNTGMFAYISCYTCKLLLQIKDMEWRRAELHTVNSCQQLNNLLFMTKCTMPRNETPKLSKPVHKKSNPGSSASLPSSGKVMYL